MCETTFDTMIMHGTCYVSEDGEWIETFDEDADNAWALANPAFLDQNFPNGDLDPFDPVFDFNPIFHFPPSDRPHRPPFLASEMPSLQPGNPFDFNRGVLDSVYKSSASHVYPRPPPSMPTSRSGTPTPEEEEYRRAARRRSLSKTRNTVPSYTQALCSVSKRIREQSLPTPDPTPRFQSRANRRLAAAQRFSASDKPPIPNSDYYKSYVKSIYEKEPLFKDFYASIPTQNRNFYSRDSLNQLKTEFHGMIGDQRTGTTGSSIPDPVLYHEMTSKLYPSRATALKDPVPASIRLEQIRSSRPRLPGPDYVPKLYMYHRSTWG